MHAEPNICASAQSLGFSAALTRALAIPTADFYDVHQSTCDRPTDLLDGFVVGHRTSLPVRNRQSSICDVREVQHHVNLFIPAALSNDADERSSLDLMNGAGQASRTAFTMR